MPKTTFFILVVVVLFVILTFRVSISEKMASVDLISNLSKNDMMKKIKYLNDKNYELTLNNDRCQQSVSLLQQMLNKCKGVFGYGRNLGPSREYENKNDPNAAVNYGNIGYLYDQNNNRYPLFGRFLYPGRSDLWEYYISDDSRNRIQIPFKSKNNKEIYDSDNVNVPTIGDLTAKIYDIEQTKYNPNLY